MDACFQKIFEDAVGRGDSHGLKKLLEERQGKFNVNFFDTEGQTALHKCVLDGNLELVKLLVKFGADTRLQNRDGWSPFHLATYSGHREIVMFLIGMYQR